MGNIPDIIDQDQEEFEPETADTLATLNVPEVYRPAMESIATFIDAVKPGCDLEAVDTAQRFVEALGKLHKVAKVALEQNLIGKINEDGQIVIGDIRLYVGNKTTRKCLDPVAAYNAMLKEAGGDESAVQDCLASQAFRPAQVEAQFPKTYAAHFETTVATDLKTGKPLKTVKKHDPRFVRSRSAPKQLTAAAAASSPALEPTPNLEPTESPIGPGCMRMRPGRPTEDGYSDRDTNILGDVIRR